MPYNPNIQTYQEVDPAAQAVNSTVALLSSFGQNMATISNNRERNVIEARKAEAEMVDAQGRAAYNDSVAAMNNATAAERQLELDRKNLEVESYKLAGPMVARQIKDHTEKMAVYIATDKGGDAYLAHNEFMQRLSPTTFDKNATLEQNQAAFIKSETFLYNKEVQEAYHSMLGELPKLAIRVRGKDGNFSHVTMQDVKLAYADGDNSFLNAVYSQTTEGNRLKMAQWLGTRVTDNGFLGKAEAMQMDAWDKQADASKIDRDEYAKDQLERLGKIEVLKKEFIAQGHSVPDATIFATEKYDSTAGRLVANTRELKMIMDENPFYDEAKAKVVQQARRIAQKETSQFTLLEAQEEIDRQAVDVFRNSLESGEVTDVNGKKLTPEQIDRTVKAHSAFLEVKRYGGVGDLSHNLATDAKMAKRLADVRDQRQKNQVQMDLTQADQILNDITETRRLKAAAKYVPANYDETKQVDNDWYKKVIVDAFARNEIHDTRKWIVDDSLVSLTKALKAESDHTGQDEPETPKAEDIRSKIKQATYIRNYLEQKSEKEDISFFMDSGRAIRKAFNSERWIGESYARLNEAEKANANSILMRFEDALKKAESKSVDDKQLSRILGQLGMEINPYKKEVMEFYEIELGKEEEALITGRQELRKKSFMSNPMQVPGLEVLRNGVPVITSGGVIAPGQEGIQRGSTINGTEGN